jgi:hypothetical protein
MHKEFHFKETAGRPICEEKYNLSDSWNKQETKGFERNNYILFYEGVGRAERAQAIILVTIRHLSP